MAKKKTQIPKYGTITLKGIQYYRTRITDFRLYLQADNMERKHIYFRGHTDGFSYLKKIGAFKTE